MKNTTLQRVAVGALALVMANSALTGCARMTKPTGAQKPPTAQTQQQKPSQNKPGQQKPSQNKPGQQKPSQNKPRPAESKVKVSKIEKTSTKKSVDTYSITFKDGNTTTFTVTYDADGKKISKIKCEADKNGKSYVVEIKDGIWCIDGETTGIKADDIREVTNVNNNKKPDNKKPANKKPGKTNP